MLPGVMTEQGYFLLGMLLFDYSAAALLISAALNQANGHCFVISKALSTHIHPVMSDRDLDRGQAWCYGLDRECTP